MKLALPSTLNVLYTTGAALAAWEAYTIINHRPGDTISATVVKLGQQQTFIPLALGATAGHFCAASEAFRNAFLLGFSAGLSFWPLLDKEEATALQSPATLPPPLPALILPRARVPYAGWVPEDDILGAI